MRIRYIFVFVLISASILGMYFVSQNFSRVVNLDPMIIPAQSGFSVSFNPSDLRMLREYPEDTYTLNGSYFGKTKTGAYFPAGLFLSGWIQFSTLDSTDPNLSHVVEYRGVGAIMRIIRVTEYDSTSCKNDCYAFQAGPLLLESGQKITNFGGSWHASERHERTILCSIEKGVNYFLLFPEPITLTNVEDFILSRGEFRDQKTTCINLDGGPSTAVSVQWSRSRGSFRPESRLPILIHVR